MVHVNMVLRGLVMGLRLGWCYLPFDDSDALGSGLRGPELVFISLFCTHSTSPQYESSLEKAIQNYT